MRIVGNTVRFGFMSALVLLLGGKLVVGEQPKPRPVSPASTEAFEIRNIEGWAVYVRKQELADHPEEMQRGLDLLQDQFYQIRLTLPPPAVAIMQQRVPLWFSYGCAVGIAFHPDCHWLLSRGYASPKGLPSLVTITPLKGFLGSSLHQPWVVCHELAHGYDYTYLGAGRHYSDQRLKDAYTHAEKSGIYDSVLCRYSQGTRHYAMSNPMEYFTESTEAYFGANDFYPFVRAELKQYDPKMYALLQDLWGVDVPEQERVARSLVKFLGSQDGHSPLPDAEGRPTFTPTCRYEKRCVEGWTVYVDPSLVRQKAYGDEICKLLRHKLYLVERYLPEKATEQLRSVPIWLEEADPAVPYATYHASADAIRATGLNPDKLHAIEIGNSRTFVRWQALQPFMMMNRLARAYFDQHLGEKELAEIDDALKRAGKSGDYDSVLRFDGKRVRHPGLVGPREFFAQMSVSYFGVNDHYPFLQFEARQHDLETCAMLAKLWGGQAK